MTKRWWQEPTRAQWAAFAAAWVGWVLDAFDFTIYLLVMPSILKEFGQTVATVSVSITLTLVVRLAGGAVSGWIADRWGRRLPLMISLVWFAVFDAAIYFAPSFAWILALRTIFGFGMGAEWTAGTALAMESMPPKSRRMASGLLQAGWPVGFLLAAATAYFVVPALGWRAMFLIAAVPAILVFPIRFFVKDDAAPIAKSAKSSPFAGLGARGVPTMLVLGALVTALGFIVYYGLTAQYSLMLMTDLKFSPQAAFIDVIIFNLGMLVGVIVTGSVASRFGVIIALVAPALLMVPCLPLFVGWVPGLVGVGAFLGGALGVGYSGVTPVLTTSLFAPEIRARAIGFVYHLGALIAAFIPWAIAEISAHANVPLSTVIGAVGAIGLVAMAASVLGLRKKLVPRSDAVPRTIDAPAGELLAS
ncbi:MAG TPA: MFS transporter [Kofleriaceae bacterium]|jgi:SHS family lactate transporter-like MFS transporter|nr:MFS transporter [Kofleriaceae bacterium]